MQKPITTMTTTHLAFYLLSSVFCLAPAVLLACVCVWVPSLSCGKVFFIVVISFFFSQGHSLTPRSCCCLLSAAVVRTTREVMVEKQGMELGFFRRPGSFFGENPVINWKGSERRERSVRAVTDCFLIFLEQTTVMDVAHRYPELEHRLLRFRRLGERRCVRKQNAFL